MSRELFPVMGGKNYMQTIAHLPFAKVERFNAQCIRNHSQTAERLAQRGGLCWRELCAVVQGRGWGSIDKGPDDAESERIVRAALEAM